MPASVSEWFSLSNGLSLLKEYSKEDLPIDPSKFQVCKFNGKNLLVFMYENNRMVCLAFENSKVDDPPVYVIRDPSDDNYPVEFVSEHCSLLEENFSGFLYKWFFDYSHWHEDGLFISALSKKASSAETLELLDSEFKTEPFDFQENREIFAYKFSNKDQKIRITNGKDHYFWHLSADTNRSLGQLHEKFGHLFDERRF